MGDDTSFRSEKTVVDIVDELSSWCEEAHNEEEFAGCLFCAARRQIVQHRVELYNLARVATAGSERDVQLTVNRLAHRYRRVGFGGTMGTLITWATAVLR